MKTKSLIHQMLSRIHVLTEKCSHLSELKLVAKHLGSAESIFDITKQPLAHSSIAVPDNTLITPQRFQSTKKRKKNATLRLAKPTYKEKRNVITCLEENRPLYQDRDKDSIPGIIFFIYFALSIC